MNEVETHIWAAGFLDGEGCFALTKKGQGCHETTRTAVVHIAQIRKAPLDRMAEAFGGDVRIMRVNNKDQTIWQWAVTGRRVIPLIEAVLPYLAGKQDEAQAVLEYAQTIGDRGRSKFDSGKPLYRLRRQQIIARHISARREV